MRVHDWTKVSAGDFHDFHQAWTVEIRALLNHGVLPEGYYAQVERVSGNTIPDVLALHEDDFGAHSAEHQVPGALAVESAPPKVQITAELERGAYDALKNQVSIFLESSKRLVAIIELVSSGNKSNIRDFRRFLDKAVDRLEQGIHLLIVDIYPPTTRDPQGIHGAIWSELGDDTYRAPPNQPLTQVAYRAGAIPKAFVEPFAVGSELTKMPLFLTHDQYVNVPLDTAYANAWNDTAAPTRRALQ